MEYSRKAIIKVLIYLYKNEPKCYPCDQCQYGYKTDKKSKNLCLKQQMETKKQHLIWEQKFKYWRDKYENS